MCTSRLTVKEQKIFQPLKKCMHRRHIPPHQRICANGLDHPVYIHQAQIGTLSRQCFQLPIYIKKNAESPTIQWPSSFQVSTKDTLQYWPFSCEYSIWNAAVSALQFWMADLKPHILSNAIDWVYEAFFYSDYTQQIWNVPEDTLFSHFVTTLNDAFKTELAQKDKGYESSMSESFNIPTPLRRPLWINHVSTMEDLSFNPVNFGQTPTAPEQHEEPSPCRNRCCSISCHQLVFTISDDESPVRPSARDNPCSSAKARSPVHRRAELSSSVHQNLCHPVTPTPTTDQFLTDAWDDDTAFSKENIPTAPLDDEVLSEDPIPDRHLCIHKSHITSIPALVHTDALPTGWTYYIQHHKVRQCLTMNWWTSVISHQIFQTSWLWWVMKTFLILQMFQMQYDLHKHSL